MVALVLMDQALRHRAQCGDVGEVAPRVPAGHPAQGLSPAGKGGSATGKR
jgi:chorismate synthase